MYNVKFRSIHKMFQIPERATRGSACFDLSYCGDDPLIIYPHNPVRDVIRKLLGLSELPSKILIPLGFAVELPVECELQIRPRSGLAAKHGITVLNSPGTIDSDYRDQVHAIMVNFGGRPYEIKPGARICQGLVSEITDYQLSIAEELTETDRQGGFGSTGE